MSSRLNILIVGSSSGLGDAVVERLLLSVKASNLFMVSRKEGRYAFFSELAKKNKNTIHYLSLDVNEKDYINELSNFINVDELDILYYNTGVLLNKSSLDGTDEEFDLLFHTNVRGFIRTVRSVHSKLSKSKRAQVLVSSSMGGFAGSTKFPGLSLYSSSKAAVANLVEVLAEEHKADGIIYNTLSFGAINTNMLKEAFPDYHCEVSGDEMASFVVSFLLGPRLFNGKNLPVSITTP